MGQVKYGATVRLRHVETGEFLNSPGVPYVHQGNSGQDQVTAVSVPSGKSAWIVKPPFPYPDDFCYGQPVRNGDIIRLENRASQKHLHSHGDRRAPLNPSQNEVTCFSSEAGGDLNDNWKIELQNEGQNAWEASSRLKLIHTMTNVSLHSHSARDAKLTSGEQEVTGCPGRDKNDLWQVDTVASPLAPIVFQSRAAAQIVSTLNLVGSLASITGITFLFIGVSLKSATYVDLISTTFASLLVLGVFSACAMGMWELYVRVQLLTRNIGWHITFWLLAFPIGLFLSVLSWFFAAGVARKWFTYFLQQVLGLP